jgi:hypothetical protein
MTNTRALAARSAAAFLLAAGGAGAQLPSRGTVQCVAGAPGCAQVDVRLTLAAGAPLTFDWFTL